MRNSKVKGFTLIELIVVIAIIGILAAILVPSMLGYVKNSRVTQANANAKQVYTSVAAALTQASIDGIILSEDENKGQGEKLYGPVNATNLSLPIKTTSKENPNALPLKDYLGEGFSGVGYAWVNPAAYTIKYACWGASDSVCGANGANCQTQITPEAQKTMEAIIGCYPLLNEETKSADGN